jgi:hypothetical protein
MTILTAPRLFILSSACWNSSSLKLSVTMPLTLTFPPSRYATARGKQYACENEPIICSIRRVVSQPRSPGVVASGTHPDLVAENLGRRPVYLRLVLVDAIDHERAAAADVVDALLRELLDAGGLDDDVEPVRVVLLQLLPLRAGVLPVELDVVVRGVQLPRDVHLDALVRGDHDAVRAVQLEQLREDEPRGAGAEQEDLDADGRVELVEAVQGTCGGLEKGRFFVGEVVDLVALLLVARQK